MRKRDTKIVAYIVFGVLISYEVSAQLYMPFKIIDSSNNNQFYGYAPNIIYENGIYHIFYCSAGIDGGWDTIRYTYSQDTIHWSDPVIVITSKPTEEGLNLAACDPSIVYYEGYYYMYYTGAYFTNNPVFQDVIHVARSENIAGPYYIYTIDDNWELNGIPKAIVYPKVKLTEVQYLGAAQQTVIKKNDKFLMWYTDDTDIQGTIQTFMIESTDPLVWDYEKAVPIDFTGGHSVDIKYDSVNDQFVMTQLNLYHTPTSTLGTRVSSDGIHWSEFYTLTNHPYTPDYAHNVGMLGDKFGHVIPGNTLIGYGAPYDFSHIDTWGQWDLVGVWVDLQNIPNGLFLINPDFDSNLGWLNLGPTFTLSSESHHGEYSAMVQDTEDVIIYQDIINSLDTSKSYNVSVWIKTNQITQEAKTYLMLHDTIENGLVQSIQVSPTQDWQQISAIFKPTDNGKLRVHIIYQGNGAPIYYDNVQITPTDPIPVNDPLDFNEDEKVNIDDAKILVSNFGSNLNYDLNYDNSVNIFDLIYLLKKI